MSKSTSYATTQCTPVRRGLSVPPGTLLLHPRWKDTDLVSHLKGKVTISVMGEIGVADFHPTCHSCVMYVTEKDIVSSAAYRRRIAKLRNARGFQKRCVLVDKTDVTHFQFWDIQKFIVLDCNMNILGVDGCKEAASYLCQMVMSAMKTPSRNPFVGKTQGPAYTDAAILSVVLKFPRIGETKAKLLLEKFKNIENIVNASQASLTDVVGESAAKQLHRFFNNAKS
uniref:Fanconi anemia core complex-associated protein 24 n=1 Tax=Phallusia mammillata TaxID=59560 RepID=A0A6F9DD02_9ASCI|nr:Fanconi anemia core complex-associated protein 24 [Phallusia mammillata]